MWCCWGCWSSLSAETWGFTSGSIRAGTLPCTDTSSGLVAEARLEQVSLIRVMCTLCGGAWVWGCRDG
jgi:hypothetical protein